jgi:putative hydrolase
MYGIELLFGAELNVLNVSGEVDLPEKIIREMDIVIASLHIPCYKGERNIDEITQAYVNVMHRGDVDIIGHPDDSRFPINYEVLVREAAQTGTILEVNHTSLKPDAYRVNARENYHQMLSLCKEYGVMVALGTDAHVDAAVGEYPYAYQLLEEEHFPEELVANTSLEKLKELLQKKRQGR